jgi:hypothetical protein
MMMSTNAVISIATDHLPIVRRRRTSRAMPINATTVAISAGVWWGRLIAWISAIDR